MINHHNLDKQIRKLIEETSAAKLTTDDFALNAVYSLEKAIASITQIKDAIQEKKGRISINEFLIIGAEFDCFSMEINEFRRIHHL